MKTQFTWKWVAKVVFTAPVDEDIRADGLAAIKSVGRSLARLGVVMLVLLARTLMLATFPVSIPALLYWFRWLEHRTAKARAMQRQAQDADV